jgi:hypothetical protein
VAEGVGKMRLFIVPDRGDTVYNLVAETGEGLASHFCSNAGFAKGDLEGRRPERQKKWREQFGEYQVMFLSEQTEITEEELLRRNEEWFSKQPQGEISNAQ